MSNNINLYIGEQIVIQRKKIGLRQEHLAQFLGVTRSNVVNMEKGRINVMPEKIVKLCSLFRCQPNDLFPFVHPVSFHTDVEIIPVEKFHKVHKIIIDQSKEP